MSTKTTDTGSGLSRKGLAEGSVGLLGAIVIGVSCIAPPYTLTGALGPTVSEVGKQVPAIFSSDSSRCSWSPSGTESSMRRCPTRAHPSPGGRVPSVRGSGG